MNKVGFVVFCCVMAATSCVHEPFPYASGGNNGGGNTSCDPDTVYFQNTILPLLVANCAYAGCHSGSNPPKGVLLTDYQSVIQTADVRAGRPDNSDLYEVISETDPNKRMPPPPSSRLSEQDIALVRKWIQQGATNNVCTDCDTTAIRYAATIQPLLDANCGGCHNNNTQNGGLALTNHSQVVQAVNTRFLFESSTHQNGFKPMPPGGKMPDCNTTQLRLWIADGMPNN